jgi:soluble lytic murein transglycosylase
VITLYSFRDIKSNSSNGTISITKEIDSKDPSCLQMYYYIDMYSDSFKIPKKFAFGIANIESSYNGPFHWNYNHKLKSPAGALGPMQVMPSTAKFINQEKVSTHKLRNDIKYNVRTSMKLLHHLYEKYGDWKLVFGAYNTGRPCVNGYSKKVYNFQPNWIE